MKKRALLIGAAVLLAIGVLGWTQRKEVVLRLVTTLAKDRDIAPYSPVAWQEGPATAPAGERPPNIVFILADDLGINDISAFGGGVAGGRVPTPNIDRLAAEGALFAQAYAGTASCAPSRAMILTGRYPTRTGFEFTPTPDGMGRMVAMLSDSARSGLPPVDWNRDAAGDVPPFDEQGLPGSEVTIAEILKGAGYHTVHIGKWHLGSGSEFGANAQGFDESLLMASGLHLPEDDPGVVNAKLDFDPIDRFLWARMQYAAAFNEGLLFAPGGYLADWWTDEAVKVIRANRNRPFFLYLAHWGVHTPLQATRADYDAVGDIKPHRLRVYAAMVRALDRSVGRVLAALEAEGLDDNTIVVFSSDNGGAGYVGLPEINAPYRGWKLTMFEGGIRVPLFMRWPARIAPGTRIARPAAHIDLMPTFAAAAGAPLPAGVAIDGIDLLAPETPPRADDALFWQSAYYRVVRQGDWKLQVTERPKQTWLFDLAADPTEKVNLADREPARVAAMTALLDAHRKAGRAPLYPHTVEAPVAIDRTLAERARPGDEYVYWPN
ncbi:sulfatase-like hydrolase/transferase [Sphingosinicella microcystinivorans]|uniref:sulfatase-like hydrolase/transferase n=1 Tax=Sphingosinicella microcystinivorans TaxID=335406 RepID=UPI0022F3F977|nr:sulfatase-like hydrolase/transferase [Sphingosinicella microcystinivorans]WBX84474.1 sulfatase-like hydrolase/transferase [Sphingosinicella microcystinivorans]